MHKHLHDLCSIVLLYINIILYTFLGNRITEAKAR